MAVEDQYKINNYWYVRFHKGPPSDSQKHNYLYWYFNYFYPYLRNNNGYLQNKYGLYVGKPGNYY